MNRKCFFILFAALAALLMVSVVAVAQTGEIRGHAVRKAADGTTSPAADAVIDVFRIDIGSGAWNAKTDKKGAFVFIGLPYVGTYVVVGSAPNAQPFYIPNCKAHGDQDFEVVLGPGDGKRLTRDEVKTLLAAPTQGNAAPKMSEEEVKRIEVQNEKNRNINEVVNRAYSTGTEALKANHYDEAIVAYDEGLAAEPAESSLLTNKSIALKARGVIEYNAYIKAKDEAMLEAAKKDFKDAADSITKALEVLKKMSAPSDPTKQAQLLKEKDNAISIRAEAMKLFVTKVDQSQIDPGLAAYDEYISILTDPAKKMKTRLEAAQMALEANAPDKAFERFKAIFTEEPDNFEAYLGAGLSLMATGDATKYQEAVNLLQAYLDRAPDGHKSKAEVKAILQEIKNTQKVEPEKTAAPPKKKRP